MTKPTNTLMSYTDASRPNVVSANLLNSKKINDEDCPWVEIGNLYVSVTIIGKNSWLPLIARLQPHTKYAVITGRHGDIPNVVDASGKTLHVFDTSHIGEDTAVKALAVAEFPNIDIKLINAGGAKIGQGDWLKTATMSNMLDGRKVIYAWCYGLFSLCEIADSAGAQNLTNMQNDVIGRSVGTLVTQYFNWVPGK